MEGRSVFPEDLYYSPEHEWLRVGSGSTARVGITGYAVSELKDVVYVSLPQVGEEVARNDAVGEVESTKSVSDVFTPVSGVITSVNDLLDDSPELVGSDPYGEGWLFEIEISDPEELEDLLDADTYAETVNG